MRSLTVLSGLLAALGLLAGTAPASPEDVVTVPGSGLGMPVIGSALNLIEPHDLQEALRNLSAAGVTLVRDDVHWHRTEPEPGTYDFADVDALAETVSRHGIELLAMLAYGNPHYSTSGRISDEAGTGDGAPPFGIGAAHFHPPDEEHLPAYRAWARALAGHLAGRVSRYEIWNEPNVGWRFWPPREDPAAYTRLLSAGSAGLREGDPAAQVSLGGLFFSEVPPGLPHSGAPRFLRGMYAEDPNWPGYVDSVAWHPYPYPFVAPEVHVPENASVPGSVVTVRAILEEHGDLPARLWVTELGWPTHEPYGVSLERQAAYLARSFALLWAGSVEVVVWYTYGDGPNASSNQEDAFGLFDADGVPKPAYAALRTFTSVLGGARMDGDVSGALGLSEGAYAYRFTGPDDERITMMWTAPETLVTDHGPLPTTSDERSVEVPVAGQAEVVGHDGRVMEALPQGVHEIAFDHRPVYVVDSIVHPDRDPVAQHPSRGRPLPDTGATSGALAIGLLVTGVLISRRGRRAGLPSARPAGPSSPTDRS